jgi:lipoate-protein ligase A
LSAAPAADQAFRLIVHPRMEGRLDMAIDEALAEAVGSGRSIPMVRLYGFSPPTLSLGRFQKVKGWVDLDGLATEGVTLVRRPTGGHAVLHDNELTYSVALPKAGARTVSRTAGGGRKREVYLFIARALLEGLSALGVSGSINAAQVGDPHNPDCFSSAGEYEITARGRKLIGSAQMTTRTAILQHGSIPLSNPGRRVLRYIRAERPLESHEPTCLNEQTGRTLSFEEVRDAFSRAIAASLGATVSDLLPEESEAAERIRAEKYASDEWNLKY